MLVCVGSLCSSTNQRKATESGRAEAERLCFVYEFPACMIFGQPEQSCVIPVKSRGFFRFQLIVHPTPPPLPPNSSSRCLWQMYVFHLYFKFKAL